MWEESCSYEQFIFCMSCELSSDCPTEIWEALRSFLCPLHFVHIITSWSIYPRKPWAYNHRELPSTKALLRAG